LTYRSDDFDFAPDSGYNANQTNPNVVGNIALPVAVKGLTYVKEAYVEFAMPLLTDIPFIKKLEIDPGYRISDYNTAGTTSTYKIMGDWTVVDWMRFRGGFQRANRAPNVAELFTPTGGSSIDFGAADACGNWPGTTPTWGNVPGNPNRINLQTLCQHLMVRDGAPASIYVPGGNADTWATNVFGASFAFPFDLAVQGGNRNLESEEADTVTAGVVFKSPFEVAALQRLNLSIDYYSVKIKGAIATPSHLTVYSQCMDAQYNSLIGAAAGSHSGAEIAANNPYCALIQREYFGNNTFGADRKFKATYVNLGGIKTDGFDVQLDWAVKFGDVGLESVPGMFTANVQFSHLGGYSQSPFPGGAYVEYKGTVVNQSYNYRMFTTMGYANGPFSVGLRWQHLPSLDPAPGSATSIVGVKSHDQVDLFGRWAFNKSYEVRAGIDNVLNATPERTGVIHNTASPGDSNNAVGSAYPGNDTFGRRLFVGVKVSL
jgi:outer membrane receptor protein involved in Fe transport